MNFLGGEAGFWVAAAAMLAVVVAVLLQALRRAPAEGNDAADAGIYRDQLAEIERDRARGVLSGPEAERMRAEVGRRLLAAGQGGDKSGGASAARPVLAGIAVLLVIALGLPAYLRLGAPGYPDMGLADRLALSEQAYAARPSQAEAEALMPAWTAPADADAEFMALIDRLRAAVAERPEDMQGLTLLARNEALLGNHPAAREAQERLVAVKGAGVTAEDLASLAEAMILAAGGVITPEAEQVLMRALELDPRNGPARYYAGILFAQVGRPDRTFGFWEPLLRDSPPDAPWLDPIRQALPDVAQAAGIRYEMPAASGPDAAAMAAAADMAPEEREAMIRGMVDQLSDRLATEGGPAGDWARLITSLGVLGEMERAEAILAEAQGLFADAPADLALVLDAAREAGLVP